MKALLRDIRARKRCLPCFQAYRCLLGESECKVDRAVRERIRHRPWMRKEDNNAD